MTSALYMNIYNTRTHFWPSITLLELSTCHYGYIQGTNSKGHHWSSVWSIKKYNWYGTWFYTIPCFHHVLPSVQVKFKSLYKNLSTSCGRSNSTIHLFNPDSLINYSVLLQRFNPHNTFYSTVLYLKLMFTKSPQRGYYISMV